MKFKILNLFAVFLFLSNASFAEKNKEEIPKLSDLDPVLRTRVGFWIDVYTKYSTSEGLIHDAKYPEIILETISLKPSEADFKLAPVAFKKKNQKRVDDIKKFYKELLLSIHKKQQSPETLTEPEKRVQALYKNVNETNKFFNAAHHKRIRLQLGQKDRFLQGLYYSGRYLSLMEKVFKEKKMPFEITRLPFVESSFNLKARSKVGASGIWQFMRSTGKLYLKINETIDERNDPLRATEAAAALLKFNFESLNESWPLAITAYNHGRKGLQRAVRKVGSVELDDIIDGYQSRSFGFASSNFFAEFMAALEVERNAEKYFGKVEREKPVEFSEFVLNHYVNILDIATYTRIPLDTLTDLNPALSDLVYKGLRYVPSGYVLRIPPERRETFLALYNDIPSHKKHLEQKVTPINSLASKKRN